jgi:GTP pyrophosphokinase
MTRLDKIIEQITSYHPTADLDVLHKAYIFSGKVHQGQYRLSGDAYLSHPPGSS